MILPKNPKRIVIFLFYDKDGIVDSYIPYMLKDIKKSVNNIFIVSNGKINDEGKKSLDGIVDTIWERKNEGFDVWGYKCALEHIGWDELNKYDEIIMMNYTIMGPVTTFTDMFDEMSERDLDFWGITKYHKVPFDPFGMIECGYIHEHLQSHFIAVRKSMFTSNEYHKYWKEMPEVHSYMESIAFHETKFTFTFDELGYKWAPYVDTTDIESMTYCPILTYPKLLIEEKKCPIFKRRSFMHDYDNAISCTCGEASYELMKYLKEETNYDVNMIWDNLLRCNNMALIKDNLQLNYVISEDSNLKKSKTDFYKGKKIALIFHSYFKDLIDDTFHYVNSMPACADIYITTDTDEKKELLEKKFCNNKFHKFEVILIENRGRDVSALLVASKKFVMDYDYVCFAHDKKVGQISMGSVGASFAYHCLENVLPSEGYVDNVIELFDNNSRLGLLTPMPPIHGDYYLTLGNEWGDNYTITNMLAKQLNINVDINKKLPPVAPLGTMFWFRPKALKKLFDKDWEYSDFPKEPNAFDGTLLHAIERIYAFATQDSGLYCAWTFSNKCASMSLTNLTYMLGGINNSLLQMNMIGNYISVLDQLNNEVGAVKHLQKAGELYSRSYSDLFKVNMSGNIMKMYIDVGNGFNEKYTFTGNFSDENNVLHCEFDIPDYINVIKNIRFDPGENGNIELKNLKIKYLFEDGKEEYQDINKCFTNGIKLKSLFLIISSDPQIFWAFNFSKKIKTVIIDSNIYYDVSQEEVISIAKKTKLSFLTIVKRFVKKLFGTFKK